MEFANIVQMLTAILAVMSRRIKNLVVCGHKFHIVFKGIA